MGILIFFIICTFCLSDVFAENWQGIEWEYDGTILTISGNGYIPNMGDANEFPWYDASKNANEIVIENGITGIGMCSLLGSNGKIFIPISVTYIDSFAIDTYTENTKIYYAGTKEMWYTIAGCGYENVDVIYNYDRNIMLDAGNSADISWALNKRGTLTVSGTGDMAFFNEYGNECIPWGNYSEKITEVIIEEGITSVDSLADCINLKSLTIPSTVNSIVSSEFNNTALSSIYISDLSAWCETNFNENSLLSSGADLYIDGTLAIDITVPKSVSYISDKAFRGYSKLKKVYIESENIKIGNYAFAQCTGLTDVYGFEKSSEIGNGIFKECTQLTKVSLPNNASEIPGGMFRNCTSLETVDIPEAVTKISAYAFDGCINLKNAAIPDSVNSLGAGVFRNCESLMDINIPEAVAVIPENAFDGCISLEKVIIPDSITEIKEYAFKSCVGLKTLTLGKGLNKLGKYAFYNCTNLETLNWNAKEISSWGNYERTSFENIGKNTDGTDVIFGDTVETIPAYVFSDGSAFGQSIDKFRIKSITVGENVKSVGNYAFINIGTLEKVNWNAKSAGVGSYIFNSSGITSKGIEFIFGDTVEYVPYQILYGFENSTAPNVTSIVIGKNVKNIGSYAFNRPCCLKTVYWNARQANVGVAIFAADGISNNYTVIFGADVEKIPSGIFDSALICSIVIESNISKIETDTFKNAKIWNITIPKSVVKIEKGAFNCNELRNIYYCGTEAEWNAIEKCEENGSLDTAELYFIADREICFFSGEKVLKKYRVAQNDIRITFEMPKRTGHEFIGWSASPQSSEILYMPGDIIPGGDSDVCLYAIWKKTAYTETIKERENGKDVFLVAPHGIPSGSNIIFICFKNGVVTDIQTAVNYGDVLTFYTNGEYTGVSIMTINGIENLIPLTEVEKIQ